MTSCMNTLHHSVFQEMVPYCHSSTSIPKAMVKRKEVSIWTIVEKQSPTYLNTVTEWSSSIIEEETAAQNTRQTDKIVV